MQFDFEAGELLLIDKPVGWTSFDIVNHLRVLIRRHLHIPKLKVGHAGTLDPLATGLLIVCTGKMTKQIQSFQDQDKTYTGTLRLGMTTPSFDLETEADETFPTDHLTQESLQEARKFFIGTISQFPPIFSAIKIDGKRAFNYARKQQEVKLEPRVVTINRFELDNIQIPDVDFVIDCSKGTYIRSLAHDFGKSLQNGACLTTLRRTHIGKFSVENALSLEQLRELLTSQNPQKNAVQETVSASENGSSLT